MKNRPACFLRSAAWRHAQAFLLLFAASRPLAAVEPGDTLNIDVRSEVDQRWHGIHKDGAIEHGKVYAIAAIKEAPAAEPMVKPLDEARLLELLRAQLNAHGFTEVTAGQKPEIVLTILYGRGWLRNPYLKGLILDEVSGDIPSLSIVTPDQLIRARSPGYESKLQAAQNEKLFIRVSAWKYPETKEEKPVNFWKTTMVIDDPDHRDLNTVTRELLAAGVRYFDRQIDEPEVRINSATKEGRVILAPLKVLESDVKKK